MKLFETAPHLEQLLTRANAAPQTTAAYEMSQIRRETVHVRMRDGIQLATDVYLPPRLPAPAIVVRTPYGRGADTIMGVIEAFARRGYVVASQDCRGTGESEPEVWEYYIYEPEDGFDAVEWMIQQPWYDGFLCSFGASYAAATQWCMSTHPRMSAIVSEGGGLQTTAATVRPYMFVNAYALAVGKGEARIDVPHTEIERVVEPQTMAGGYFNEPLRRAIPASLLERYPHLHTLTPAQGKRWLWKHVCTLPPAQRTELLKELVGASTFTFMELCSLPIIFDAEVTAGFHTMPSGSPAEMCRRFNAPALIVIGWYDWNLDDLLPSWAVLRREAQPRVAENSRLIITPASHNMTGYHEDEAHHPELRHNHRYNVDLMLRWFQALRRHTLDDWPRVIYYLMGANEWRTAQDWPVPEATPLHFYLGPNGALSPISPEESSNPDRYTYDPVNPTPTVGGSIVSYLYPPGSVDVREVQKRADVLTYTTKPLEEDLDVVGPVRLILFASSSAQDTDFSARLSDVFPDGRAVQLQSGMIRTRYRDVHRGPEWLEPGRIYRFEIDVWATANRFKRGHRLCLDISSADFPRFDRNSNRGGETGPPVPAIQQVYHDPEHDSHLIVSVLRST